MDVFRRYTVGWISIVDPEIVAARAVLDEIHPRLSTVSGDDNHYLCGSIGNHNVVIAYLPSGTYGTNAAARVAAQMQRTFPELRFGLLVGIGGGIPNDTVDIRLGDVMVSTPNGKSGGVVQYDLGKIIEGRKYPQRVGMLDQPPSVLRKAVAGLKARLRFEPDSLSDHIETVLATHPSLGSEYSHPGSERDLLFKAGYKHDDSSEDCRSCDPQHLSDRPRRLTPKPAVHYGTIGSGSQVVKNSVTRDYWHEEEGVICFEMEAAGLMNDFPCLVIRGICDYADSHNQKQWQPYAALTAATYARDLLLERPSLSSAVLPPKIAAQNDNISTKQQAKQINHFSGSISTAGGKAISGRQFDSGGGSITL